jgi:hypothetical protein
MTDHPRFEPVSRAPDQAHLGYHGGRLVNSVLRLVDAAQAMRGSRKSAPLPNASVAIPSHGPLAQRES